MELPEQQHLAFLEPGAQTPWFSQVAAPGLHCTVQTDFSVPQLPQGLPHVTLPGAHPSPKHPPQTPAAEQVEVPQLPQVLIAPLAHCTQVFAAHTGVAPLQAGPQETCCPQLLARFPQFLPPHGD